MDTLPWGSLRVNWMPLESSSGSMASAKIHEIFLRTGAGDVLDWAQKIFGIARPPCLQFLGAAKCFCHAVCVFNFEKAAKTINLMTRAPFPVSLHFTYRYCNLATLSIV